MPQLQQELSLVDTPPWSGSRHGCRVHPWAFLCGQGVQVDCACFHLPIKPHPLRTHLEVLIDQEVTADEVEVPQLALQLRLDCQEAVGHDLLHPLLWAKQEGYRLSSASPGDISQASTAITLPPVPAPPLSHTLL